MRAKKKICTASRIFAVFFFRGIFFLTRSEKGNGLLLPLYGEILYIKINIYGLCEDFVKMRKGLFVGLMVLHLVPTGSDIEVTINLTAKIFRNIIMIFGYNRLLWRQIKCA